MPSSGFLGKRGARVRHPVDFYPERCALGAASVPFTAGFDTFVLLTNDDDIGRYIRVYYLDGLNDGIFQQNSVTIFNGVAGNFVMRGQCMVTDKAPPPGAIYSGTTTTEFGTPIGSGAIAFGSQLAGAFPVAVLARGWSLVCFGGAVGNSVQASFIWMID